MQRSVFAKWLFIIFSSFLLYSFPLVSVFLLYVAHLLKDITLTISHHFLRFFFLFRYTHRVYPRYCAGYIAMGKWISLFVMVSFSRCGGTLVRQLCLSFVHEFGAWRIHLLSIITIRYARNLDKSEFWYVLILPFFYWVW